MSTFRAYLITPPAGPRIWSTVGAEAQGQARREGGTCATVEVPATKAALIPFLNDLEKRLVGPPAAQEPAEAPTVAPAPVALPSAPPAFTRAVPKPGDVDAIVDWVFDGATPSEVADIFLGLSARFTETARLRRAA